MQVSYRKYKTVQSLGGFRLLSVRRDMLYENSPPPVFTSSSFTLPWEGENPVQINS